MGYGGSKTYVFAETILFENLRDREGGTDTHNMWRDADDLENSKTDQHHQHHDIDE